MLTQQSGGLEPTKYNGYERSGSYIQLLANIMKRILTAFLLTTFSCAFGQPKELTVENALDNISAGNYYTYCPLKWMPDSCSKLLEPFNCKVFYGGGLKEGALTYDSVMNAALHDKFGNLWDTVKFKCSMCFMEYYGKYKATQLYDLDGDILDPSTAQRHIDEGKLYYLTYGSLTSESLPEGFNECEREIYEGLGLKVKWLGGTTVKLAPTYNSYVFEYLDSINHTTGTEEKASQAFRECVDNWNKKK